MKHLFSGLLLLATALLLAPTTLHAQSGAFTYQGRVTVGGTNFTGTGQFKFALVTGSGGFLTARASATVFNGFIIGYTVTEPGSGYTSVPAVRIEDSTGSNAVAVAVLNGVGGITNLVIPINGNGFGYSANPRVTIDPPAGASMTTYWNHDGSSGTEPEGSLALPVQDGLFTVDLGNPATGTAPIAPEMFHVDGLRLRIWFNDGTNGWAALEPSHILTAAPSASVARSLSWSNLVDVPATFQNGPTNVGAGLTLVSNTIGLASNAITAGLLASNAVTAAALANGAIEPAALSTAVSQRLFWTLQGNVLLGTNTVVSTNSNGSTTNQVVFTNSFALGTVDHTPLHLQVNGQRAFRIEPSGGTPNLIGGHLGNTVPAGVVGAVIGGGGEVFGSTSLVNRAEGNFATVSGGRSNVVGTGSTFATIGGGNANRIDPLSPFVTIGGGSANQIQTNAYNSTISGGHQNSIGTNSANSTVSGGRLNKIAAGSGTGVIAGGSENSILTNTSFAVIGGGNENAISGDYATVPGGHLNLAGGNYSFAAGRRAKALHAGAFVWGDSSEGDVASTNANQVTVRASGGVRIFSTSGLTKGVFLPQGGDSWSQISDAAVKKNRVSVDGRETLEKLAAIPIDRWHYVWDDDSSTPNLGPMAQDFKHAFFPGRDDQSISTSEFDGVALSAIQGLNQKLEEKDAELKALRAEMETLKAQVREALAKP